MDEIEQEILRWNLEVDPRRALKGMADFQKKTSKGLKDVDKEISKLDKGFFKFAKQLSGSRKYNMGVKDLQNQLHALDTVMGRSQKELADRADKIRSLSSMPLPKAAKQQLNQLKKEYAMLSKKYDPAELGKQRADMEERLTDSQEAGDHFDTKSLVEGAEEAGKDLADPLELFLKKDAVGIFQKGANILAFGLKSGIGKAGMGLKTYGVQQAAGGGTIGKVVGGISKSLGSFMQMIGKLGPLLQMSAGFLASFIQIALDSEAAVKDYNKQIIALNGSGQFLERSIGNVGDATSELSKTLDEARAGVNDLANVQLGITKEMGTSFQTALAQEGVALETLGKQTKVAAGYATSHAKAIQMNVAFSRALGVSLSELTQLQGEMMSEMGSSIDSVEASFENLAQSAVESGYQTSKFFNIVKSFSSDLTLFTLRMDELAKVTKVLGQTMSPRTAQKFLQNLSGRFKGGVHENLPTILQAGEDRSRSILKRDANSKLESLLTDIASTLGKNKDGTASAIDELRSILKNSNDPHAGQEIGKWQAKYLSPEMNGLKDSIQDAMIQIAYVNGKSAFELAAAAAGSGLLAKKELLEAAAMGVYNKKIADLQQEQLAAVANSNGIDLETLNSIKKFDNAVVSGQEEMIAHFASGKASPEEEARAKKILGDKYSTTDMGANAKLLRAAYEGPNGTRKFWDSLDKSQQELLDKGEKQIDFQSVTADFQVSNLDKLDILKDILLNKIYDVLRSIWDSVKDIYYSLPGVQGKSPEEMAGNAVNATKNRGLINAYEGSGGNMLSKTMAVINGPGKQLVDNLDKLKDEAFVLKKALGAKDLKEGQEKYIKDRLKELAPILDKNLDLDKLRGKVTGSGEDSARVFSAIDQLSDVMPELKALPSFITDKPRTTAAAADAATTTAAAEPMQLDFSKNSVGTAAVQKTLVTIAFDKGADQMLTAKVQDGIVEHERNRSKGN